MAYLYVDTDSAMAAGREIYGFPKKSTLFLVRGQTSINESHRRVTEREGVELFKLSVQSVRPGAPDALTAMGYPVYNLKIISSVKKGAQRDVRNNSHDAAESAEDPLHLLQPVEVLK